MTVASATSIGEGLRAMHSLELLLRPDLGKKAYRLRCRFVIGAYPSEWTLEKAKFHAADLFVKDMAKQGWENVSKHGFKMSGPFAPVQVVNLPKASQQEQWHTPSKDMIAAITAGYRPPPPAPNYVQTVPDVAECDDWEFELAGVFVHPAIMTEVPDPHEEREG